MLLDWEKYIAIADRFQHRARYQDREDLRQEIIVRLAEVASNNGHEPFTEIAMIRVASNIIWNYWYHQNRHRLISLNSHIDGEDGEMPIEMIDVIADDKAIDLEAWLDAKTWLLGCPKRLVEIAHKRVSGIPLEAKDQEYLRRFWRKSQRRLF